MIRERDLEKVGDCIPIHEHHFDHTVFVLAGSIETGDGREFRAPAQFLQPSYSEHTFTALEDRTKFLCVFARPEKYWGLPEIAEEEHAFYAEKLK